MVVELGIIPAADSILVMTISPFCRFLASMTICLASLFGEGQATELPSADSSGMKDLSSVQTAGQEHASVIDKFMRDYVNDVLLSREKRYAVGDYSTSREELERKESFDAQVKNYIAGIGQLSTLETLCNHLWCTDVPEDMPTGLWTDAEESVKWFLCERIAKFGTQEAYDALSRLRNAYSDGAWCGSFRSLEWKYLRQYSKDPAVLKSKSGVFH